MTGSVKVAFLTKKMTEKRVKSYGHVKRMEEGCMLMLGAHLPTNADETV